MKRKPRPTVNLDAPIAEVIKAVSTPPPALREYRVWNGMVLVKCFTKTPRINRLEVSKPQGSGVGENPIRFLGNE